MVIQIVCQYLLLLWPLGSALAETYLMKGPNRIIFDGVPNYHLRDLRKFALVQACLAAVVFGTGALTSPNVFGWVWLAFTSLSAMLVIYNLLRGRYVYEVRETPWAFFVFPLTMAFYYLMGAYDIVLNVSTYTRIIQAFHGAGA